MSGFRLSPVSGRRLRLLGSTVFAGAAALAVVACSAGPPAQAQDAPIAIRTSQLSIVIENKVGMPLTDVDVSIVPVGGATEFKKFVGRMESAEKKDLSLGGFYGRDGTTFSLRVVRPRIVRVTGKDLNAKAYSVEAPWQ
jgi:type IV pilus biogenesis protein CpaD/CtpE